MTKRVLVVGAGPSGMCAVKECLEKGFEVVSVDAKPYFGGVFGDSYDNGCYDTLYLTTSNVFMAFSDFPVAEKTIRYSQKDEYATYLKNYADHFNLHPHMKLSTTVDSAKWCERARVWKVTTTTKGCAPETAAYNAIMVCTGANQAPKMPLTEQFKPFKGEIIHSAYHKSTDKYKGKRVLVIGQGESASDIITDISMVTDNAVLWTRSEMMLAPRFPDANILDGNHDEGNSLLGTQDEFTVSDFLETMTTARMGTHITPGQFGLVRQFLWAVGPPDAKNLLFKELCRAAKAASNATWRNFVQADQTMFATKNARMAKPIALGLVKHIIAEKVTKVSADGFEFSNGDACKVDAVICCTGYETHWNWLEEDIGTRCPRHWYKHAFPACFNEKPIVFMGYCRGHQGGIPQMAEMVARYATLLLNDERALPEGFAAAAIHEGQLEQDFWIDSPNLKALVNYPGYMDSMARLVGCEPSVPWLSPSMMMKYLFFPQWPAWYRFNGPGASPKNAQKVFDTFTLKENFKLNPLMAINVLSFFITKACAPLQWLLMPKSGIDGFGAWLFFRPLIHTLHGNHMRFRDIFRP